MTSKYQTDSQRRLIDILYHLDIKRLILDSSQIGIQPELLMKFRNIVYLSSNIFEPYSIFPLYLCNELKSLEIINFQYNSSLRLSEFKNIKYSDTFINRQSPPRSTYFDSHRFSKDYYYLKLFKFPRQEIVKARRNFSIRIKRAPNKWTTTLQKQTSHWKHPIY